MAKKAKKKGARQQKQRSFVAGGVPTGGVRVAPQRPPSVEVEPAAGEDAGVTDTPASTVVTRSTTPVSTTRPAPGQQRVGGDQMLVRNVEMSLGATARPVRRGGRMIIEGTDPAIPLANVPYFTHDLMRLGIVGAAMVVLLVLSSIFILPLVR